MIWRDAVPHKAVRHWKRFVHINASIAELRHDAVGGIEAGGTGTDDGQSEGTPGGLFGGEASDGARRGSAEGAQRSP